MSSICSYLKHKSITVNHYCHNFLHCLLPQCIFILRANQMIILFIRVLPPGCPGLHLMINCVFCHPPSKAPRILYTAKHILIPWSDFDNIWHGIFFNHAKKCQENLKLLPVLPDSLWITHSQSLWNMWPRSFIYQHTHPKQYMTLPNICS